MSVHKLIGVIVVNTVALLFGLFLILAGLGVIV